MKQSSDFVLSLQIFDIIQRGSVSNFRFLESQKAFDALQIRLNDSSSDEIEMLEVIQVRTHIMWICPQFLLPVDNLALIEIFLVPVSKPIFKSTCFKKDFGSDSINFE